MGGRPGTCMGRTMVSINDESSGFDYRSTVQLTPIAIKSQDLLGRRSIPKNIDIIKSDLNSNEAGTNGKSLRAPSYPLSPKEQNHETLEQKVVVIISHYRVSESCIYPVPKRQRTSIEPALEARMHFLVSVNPRSKSIVIQ